jgi:type I restriction enzyme, S subunit
MDMLLEQFKILFDRPEKVKKVRELILQLAVRGKLVPQDENDESASVLLESIREEKERLVKDGKIKTEKPLLEIRDDEKPYELPKGWEWVRLREIGYNLGQKKPDRKFTYIDVGSINKELGILGEEKNILNPEGAPSRARKLVDLGTVIYSTVRPYLLNIAIIDREFDHEPIVSTAFAVVHPYKVVNNKFIYHYLRSQTFVKYVESQMVGMAYPAINEEKFFAGLIPLPPLNEQKRIVEKLDSLMSFCNKLEKELERKVKYSSLSSKSVFNSIGNCSSAQELEETLRFIIENFKNLTLGYGAVKELKNAILQLAVQGKLVPQDCTDEPASVLLERIKEEKERLISEGKIKREKPLSEIGEEENPYELPDGWEWKCIGDVSYITTGGTPPTSRKELFNGDIPFLNPGNIKDRGIIYEGKRISKEAAIFTNIISKESILVTCINGSLENGIGRCNYTNIEVACNQQINAITPICMFYKYLNYSLKSPIIANIIKANASGTVNFIINKTRLSNIPIPVPPLNEQNRIVEKVDSLMSLCDKLENRIEKSNKYSENLMEAVLKEVFKA